MANQNRPEDAPLALLIGMAIETLVNNPSRADREIIHILADKGIDPALARTLYQFITTATARLFLSPLKVRFDQEDVFQRVDSKTGAKTEYRFSENTLYRVVVAEVQRWRDQLKSSEDFLAVACRSAEVQGVNNLLLDGSKPESIVLTRPVYID